ncbi:hypothetical protein [Arthrobacter sp. UYEF20]|uniref:hypothetical protein n=1 Tax=Arthrobacter sp. UYEF20 TaxID=1756363 RepID=UPI00339AD19D
MRIFRRVVMPVAWLAVFAVIAVALVKIAFVDGMKPGPAVVGPQAEVTIPVVQAIRATVTNTVQIKATIQSDAPLGVRNTAAGVVSHIFLSPGAKVNSGERLYQVRAEVPAEPTAESVTGTSASAQPGGTAARPARTIARPTYTYTDVLAPSSGELETLTVLIDQQVGVGESTGTVNPGTFTVGGSVDAAQQYRLLAKPSSARISVVGGPAPFECASVVLKSADSGSAGIAGGSTGGNGSGGISGGAARSVPYAASPGGGGAPEQGGTPTGTISCPVPAEVEVFAGLGATMTVTAGQAIDVITVPLTSVDGSVKEGSVWIAPAGAAPEAAPGAVPEPAPDAAPDAVPDTAPGAAPAAAPDPAPAAAPDAAPGAVPEPAPDAVPEPVPEPAPGAAPGQPAGNGAGQPQQRKVQLGLNDGSVVEIVSGLAEGESVLEFIPGAPAQVQPGPGFAGPGSFPAGG